MRWEELSGEAFERGVEACRGVCLLPVGVLEYHGRLALSLVRFQSLT